MRHLASIQRIHAIDPIEGADAIEVVSVLGWKIVVKKGEFKKGDLCVYCEIDSILPNHPKFEFLRSKKFRVKTVKMRGQISQGIVFPLEILEEFGVKNPQLDLDVTEALGVTKLDPQEIVGGMGDAAGNFPEHLVPKTDETRIQSVPQLLPNLYKHIYYISEKADGTSATFLMTPEKEFLVCSRNRSIKDGDNLYWFAARKYGLEKILSEFQIYEEWRPLAIQGELVGPGIQKNRLKLNELKLLVFNVYDIRAKQYWNFVPFQNFCDDYNLETVKILRTVVDFTKEITMNDLLKMAKGQYSSGHQREGIVIRTMYETFCPELKGRFSFKVINNDYLLKVD